METKKDLLYIQEKNKQGDHLCAFRHFRGGS